MNLRFDPNTLRDFQDNSIVDICVYFETKWCAGLKIHFEPYADQAWCTSHQTDQWLTIWCRGEDEKKLDGGQIAVADGRIYFVSPDIQNRCGCGTSISFEEGNILVDLSKIHRLSQKLSNIPAIKNIMSWTK